jgi:hypothetical protein
MHKEQAEQISRPLSPDSDRTADIAGGPVCAKNCSCLPFIALRGDVHFWSCSVGLIGEPPDESGTSGDAASSCYRRLSFYWDGRQAMAEPVGIAYADVFPPFTELKDGKAEGLAVEIVRAAAGRQCFCPSGLIGSMV